jgi:hypothetical protein
MATTPDQRVAKDQLQQLRMLKRRLQDEKAILQNASSRIQEINAEIDAINVQIDIIKTRDPDEVTQNALSNAAAKGNAT